MPASIAQASTDLVLYFGNRAALTDAGRYQELRAMFPSAVLMGCSTGGQICGDDVTNEGITAIALRFENTPIRTATATFKDNGSSQQCGEAIGHQLAADDLAGIFVLSDGLDVNGSELIAGIASRIGNVPVFGGLAGDGPHFMQTLVGLDGVPASGAIAAVGMYGGAIKIGLGSAGGWDIFGPKRLITRSRANVLLQLDGRPALDLYEKYLGTDEIDALPGSALVFPLQIHDPRRPDHEVVRTVLAIDRAERSMTFAGDMPEGWIAQLMRGSFDRLAAGAGRAAHQARQQLHDLKDDQGIAILVSCIGRKLLMGQKIEREVEASGIALGSRLTRIGFYSYGEITPHATSGICELHNQTMTVMTMSERIASHG